MLDPASADGFGEARRSDDENSASRRRPAPEYQLAQPAAPPELHPTAPEARGGGPVLPAQRLGAAIEVFLCSGFPTQILLIAVLAGLGMRMQTEPGRLSPTFVFTLSLLDTVLVIGLALFFLRAHGESARQMLLGNRPIPREALAGLVLTPVVFFLVLVVLAMILSFAPQLHNVPRNPLEDMLLTRRDALVFAVVVMAAGGIREEVQRGFILRRFQQYLGGGVVGVVLYSVLFGLGHLEQGMDAALATAFLGAAWGCVFLARRSIVAPMVSHAGFNLAQLVKYAVLAVR